jgi:benzoyl-CoA reductase/2-hydroxyglutaryl-CoA dehydratase subunit BcrC/BadD/HgdB
MKRRIGITSTVPIEVVLASGNVLVDLNNSFIESDDSQQLVEKAERRGFPESSCAWIKGIYSAAHSSKVDAVIAVLQGDCSNTHALMETLEMEGLETIPFLYPYDRDRRFLDLQMERLREAFDVSDTEVLTTKRELDVIREKVRDIDRLTWQEGLVTGFENHYYQVSCSDMRGNPGAFESEIDEFAAAVRTRKPLEPDLRLGFIGIPPIIGGIYEFVESHGGHVVFNELQRQFSMPHGCDDILDQYLAYTYPYHIKYRLVDIKREIEARGLDGIIHYVQAFCFRQIEDIIIRKEIDLPVLTLEGNRPGRIDVRTKIRIEAFLDMLGAR